MALSWHYDNDWRKDYSIPHCLQQKPLVLSLWLSSLAQRSASIIVSSHNLGGVVNKTGARQFSFSLDSWDNNTHKDITCRGRGALKGVVTVSGTLLNILLLLPGIWGIGKEAQRWHSMTTWSQGWGQSCCSLSSFVAELLLSEEFLFYMHCFLLTFLFYEFFKKSTRTKGIAVNKLSVPTGR